MQGEDQGEGHNDGAAGDAADAQASPATAFDAEAWQTRLLALNPWAEEHQRRLDALAEQGLWECDYDSASSDEGVRKAISEFKTARKAAALKRWRQEGDADGDAKARWNAWGDAMLALRGELDAANLWKEDPRNQSKQQGQYITYATVDFGEHSFTKDADFSGFVFPGMADFGKAEFGTKDSPVEAVFRAAQFHGVAWFTAAQFHGEAWFRWAQFHREAWFTEAQFHREAGFEGAQFLREAAFDGSQFHGEAVFEAAQFQRAAEFGEAQFQREAWFDWAQFYRDAWFRLAQFHGEAWFDEAQFHEEAGFGDAQFHGAAVFRAAQFHGAARFRAAQFHGAVWFGGARFGREQSASGSVAPEQPGPSPTASAQFTELYCGEGCDLSRSQINCPITFGQSVFKGPVSFQAAQVADTFFLTDCRFESVPDLTQATFSETPRLDDIRIADPMRERRFLLLKACADKDAAAKYRALRKHAIANHDHERELEFHAREIQCARFWENKPYGVVTYELVADEGSERSVREVSKAVYKRTKVATSETLRSRKPGERVVIDKRKRPAGAGKFWFGWLYGGVSDFGRSLVRPFLFWAGLIPVFALLYLLARPEAPLVGIKPPEPPSFETACPVLPPLSGAWDAVKDMPYGRWCRSAKRMWWPTTQACYSPAPTTPPYEAVSLALKNAFVVINWDRTEAARRTYGCLYGFLPDEVNGEAGGEVTGAILRYPYVPLTVSLFSLVQNILSAILIFLFLLGLRNMLKLK